MGNSDSSERVITILAMEAFIASLYIVITRGLAPIMMYSIGLSLKEIIGVNILAYLASLLTAYLIHKTTGVLRRKVKGILLIVYVSERFLWGLLPLTLALSRTLFYAIYVCAVVMTVPTTILINTLVFTLLNSDELRLALRRRGALGALSSILGQVFIIMVLASIKSVEKYVYLYLIGLFIGLLSTIMITSLPNVDLRKIPLREGGEVSEEKVKAVNMFTFLSLLLASTSIIGVVWAPYLMRYLKVADYIAASLGFVQMLTNIIASLYWSKASFNVYKVAIMISSLIPIAIMISDSPIIHLLIASIYSFSVTGSNFLASLLYGAISKGYDPLKSSTKLVAASSLAQVIGLSITYLIPSGRLIFVPAAILALIASLIALTTIPEVAIPKEPHVRLYSRILYNLSISGYTFMIFTLRSTVLLTLRLLGFTLIFIILYIIYRTLFYIITMTYH